MNFYKRHIGDYLKDTAHLSLLEHGVYTRLLDVYYTRESGIPDSQAARLVGARSKDECAALKVVLGEFFNLIDDAWVQDRCEREIELASAQAEANRSNGKKGGRPKAKPNPDKTEEKPNGFSVGSVSESEKNLSQTPLAISQTPDSTSQDSKPDPPGTVIAGGITPRGASDDSTPKDAGEWQRYFREKHGVELDPTSLHDRKKAWPLFTAWVKAGVSVAQMDAAVEKAQTEAQGAIAFLPAYVDRVLASLSRPAGPARLNPDEHRRAISDANSAAWLAGATEDPNVIDMEN